MLHECFLTWQSKQLQGWHKKILSAKLELGGKASIQSSSSSSSSPQLRVPCGHISFGVSLPSQIRGAGLDASTLTLRHLNSGMGNDLSPKSGDKFKIAPFFCHGSTCSFILVTPGTSSQVQGRLCQLASLVYSLFPTGRELSSQERACATCCLGSISLLVDRKACENSALTFHIFSLSG